MNKSVINQLFVFNLWILQTALTQIVRQVSQLDSLNRLLTGSIKVQSISHGVCPYIKIWKQSRVEETLGEVQGKMQEI